MAKKSMKAPASGNPKATAGATLKQTSTGRPMGQMSKPTIKDGGGAGAIRKQPAKKLR